MKQGWEIKKLGEVCDIINGFAFKSNLFTDEGEDILRISNIQNGYVDLTDIAHFSKDDYPKTNFEKYAVLPNDIVVALSGATTGKFGINKTGKKLYLNQRIAICRESSSELNHLFLLYYLQTQSKSFLESAEGVAQPNLSTEQMKQYDIPIPPREEQERIVEELDCLSGVIEKKREQLKQLDALAQSIFYQMFGDPITNEKGWEVKRINEVCSIFGRIGFRGYTTNDLVSNSKDGAISLSPSNIINGHLDYSKCTYISWFKYEESPEIKIYNEDILLVKTGSSYGKCALVRNLPHKATINPQFVVLKNFKINNRYLTCCLQSYPVKFEFDKFTIGAAIPTFSQKNLGNMQIAIPPLTFQQEFAEKIEAIEKQKALIKQSITQTETLFNARMDYYFN